MRLKIGAAKEAVVVVDNAAPKTTQQAPNASTTPQPRATRVLDSNDDAVVKAGLEDPTDGLDKPIAFADSGRILATRRGSDRVICARNPEPQRPHQTIADPANDGTQGGWPRDVKSAVPDRVDGRPNPEADVSEGRRDSGPAGAHLQDARARRSRVHKRRWLLLLAVNDSLDAIPLEVLAGLKQAEVGESRVCVSKIPTAFDVPLWPERP